jgi:hypothetical protein
MNTATTQRLQREADAWNAQNPVGTPVEYWTGIRDLHPKRGTIRHPAQIMSDHLSAWVTGSASCIALSHIQPLTRIKCLTLWQPWASAMAVGAKQIETRGYPGEKLGLREGDLVAIHAAARKIRADELGFLDFHQVFDVPSAELPYSSVLSLHRYNGSAPAQALRKTNLLSELEEMLGDYSDGRFGWHLPLVRRFETPIPHTVKQGIGYWTPPAGLELLP